MAATASARPEGEARARDDYLAGKGAKAARQLITELVVVSDTTMVCRAAKTARELPD
jgi:hypothetical protein